jgi:hypothetical protein
MHARKGARVLPEPVGAQIRVLVSAAWGSVGSPKRLMNHSRTIGCAQSSELGDDLCVSSTLIWNGPLSLDALSKASRIDYNSDRHAGWSTLPDHDCHQRAGIGDVPDRSFERNTSARSWGRF